MKRHSANARTCSRECGCEAAGLSSEEARSHGPMKPAGDHSSNPADWWSGGTNPAAREGLKAQSGGARPSLSLMKPNKPSFKSNLVQRSPVLRRVTKTEGVNVKSGGAVGTERRCRPRRLEGASSRYVGNSAERGQRRRPERQGRERRGRG